MAAAARRRQGYVVKKEFLSLGWVRVGGVIMKEAVLRVKEKVTPLPSPVLHGTWANCQL